MPRRRLEFEPGFAASEAAKLKKFSDAGGSRIQWLSDAGRTQFLGLLGYIWIGFFLIHTLLSSCSSHKDKKMAEDFLKKFLLEEGGIYTLHGNKPLTDVLIFVGTEQDISLEGLSEESLKKITYCDDPTHKNWIAWKNLMNEKKFKNFIFAERACPYDPLHRLYILANIEKLKEELQKHNALFCERLGIEEIDIDQAIGELEDPESIFWDRVFKDHYLSGLVHGYGENNSQYFMEKVNKGERMTFSTAGEGNNPLEPFPLPVFAAGKDDPMTASYTQQRKKIKKFYQRKDFLETALKTLSK